MQFQCRVSCSVSRQALALELVQGPTQKQIAVREILIESPRVCRTKMEVVLAYLAHEVSFKDR